MTARAASEAAGANGAAAATPANVQPAKQQPQAAAVLVRDGCRVAPAPGSPQTLLAEHRGGSYTTALVINGWRLLDWQLHLGRLARNIQLLAEQQPPTYAAFTAWLQQQQQQQDRSTGGAAAAATEQVLEQLIGPQVALALQLLAAEHSQQQQQHQQHRAMLTILVTDPAEPAAPEQLPLSVFVWAKALPPADPATPAKALVAGDPRPLAQAKHCDWVLQRRPLEALKQQQGGFDEVLLLNDVTGELLEGLVSNFYVIADASALLASAAAASTAGQKQPPTGGDRGGEGLLAAAAAAGAAGAEVSGLVLMTTGSSDAALLGVTQQRMLQACAAIGLRVLLQAPRRDQAAAWREAFLTNCVKGIQPVGSIQLSARSGSPMWHSSAGSSSSSSTSSSEVGRVTALLQEALQQLQEPLAADMRKYL